MLYAIKYKVLNNGMLTHSIIVDDYESEIATITPGSNILKNSIKLTKEIIEHLEKIENGATIAIEDIDHVFRSHFVEEIYDRLPDLDKKRIQYLKDKSKKQYDEYVKTIEFEQECIENDMKLATQLISKISHKSKEYNFLDSQQYLDFIKYLNEYGRV